MKRTAILAFLLVLCGGMLCSCSFGKRTDNSSLSEDVTFQTEESTYLEENSTDPVETSTNTIESTTVPDHVQPINAEQFLNRIGTIQAKYDVQTSDKLLTGEKVYQILEERGFVDCDIIASFAIDGTYKGAELICATDKVQYPCYEAYYCTDDIMAWNLTVVGNAIFVTPINYNIREDISVQRMYAETPYLLSYDNLENKFFEVVPNADDIELQVLKSITASELDRLAKEVLN